MIRSLSLIPTRQFRLLSVLGGFTALAFLSLLPGTSAHAAAPLTQAPIDLGRAVATGDDNSAIAGNPANLALMPGWDASLGGMEAHSRWLNSSAVHAAFAIPFWRLASGLSWDAHIARSNPPARLDPLPANDTYHWVRWALAGRLGRMTAIGTTFAWSASRQKLFDGAFSASSGVTFRPSPFIGLGAVARDWNQPNTDGGLRIPRSFDFGVSLRPYKGLRLAQIDLETGYQPNADSWNPRLALGVDVPHVGRLRGDLSFPDVQRSASRNRVAIVGGAGLDVNIGRTQVEAGAVFGGGRSPASGWFLGGSVRDFREPGVLKAPRVARIDIDKTPGGRNHIALLQRMWEVARSPEWVGLVLAMRAEPAGSMANAEEIADAVRFIRSQGKKVLCQLEDAGGKALQACGHADRIAMNPAGGLRFSGLANDYRYFGQLLERLHVEAEFVRIGAHKLAAEQLTLPGGSAVAHQDHQELIDQLERILLTEVAPGRQLTTDALKASIAGGPYIAPEARAAKLVDTLAYRDEMDRVAEEMFGQPVQITKWKSEKLAPARWGTAPKIAVIHLTGNMVDGDSTFIPILNIQLTGSNTIVAAIQRARRDPSVKAIVFRVSTGGGSSMAADVILHELQITAKSKPIVVSMGSTAASGGYYASVIGKDVPVFANRSTITGSIGIFYGKVDFSGLLERVGIRTEQFRSSPRADAESLFRGFSDDERQLLGTKVKQFYDLFIARVAEGRNMTGDAVDAVARGKVWTGEQAKAHGLVDHIGGLRQALDEARRLGKLDVNAPLMQLPEQKNSMLRWILDLAGLRMDASKGTELAMTQLVPPQMLELARAMAPIVLSEASDRPLAISELVGAWSSGDGRDESALDEP
jgi:protease-4